RRAAFYGFNHGRYHRANGANGRVFDTAMVTSESDIDDVDDMFDWSGTVSGGTGPGRGGLIEVPERATSREVLLPLFDQYLESHRLRHLRLRERPSAFAGHEKLSFEMTSEAVRRALAPDGVLTIETLTSDLLKGTAQVIALLPTEPWIEKVALDLQTEGNQAVIDIRALDEMAHALRLTLQVTLQMTRHANPHRLIVR
ncbi:MAG: hypothetical protein ACR2J8_10140, partial [Thermomicrobiales bacterium]